MPSFLYPLRGIATFLHGGEWADSFVGDLLELYADRLRTNGRFPALFSLAREIFHLLLGGVRVVSRRFAQTVILGNVCKVTASEKVTALPGLTEWRQTKSISLEEISDRTKINLKYLRAIEAEEFDKLPGGIFSTSYLRQYAAAVEFDPTELLIRYWSLSQPQTPNENGIRGRRQRRHFSEWQPEPSGHQ
jgi:hypothetical protein